MSLATRCIACGTVFRVVQDQLKVSEGWVRCGRCNEVFNALEGLFDLERDAPGAIAAPPSRRRHAQPPRRPSAALPATRLRRRRASRAARQPIALPRSRIGRGRRRSPAAVGESTASTRRRSCARPHRAADPTPGDPRRANVIGSNFPMRASTPRCWIDEDDAPPDPLHRGPGCRQRRGARGERARIRTPRSARRAGRVRSCARCWRCAGVAVGCCSRCSAAHQFRDTIAARWPASQPALLAWCGLLGCTLEAPRRIDDVGGREHGAGARARTRCFKLAVTVRNHGAVAVAMPSVDLTLTDPSGQLVARSVLRRTTSSSRRRPSFRPAPKLALQLRAHAGDGRASPATRSKFLSLTAALRDAARSHSPYSFWSLHVGTDLRFPRVRHDHRLSRDASRTRSCRAAAHPERVVPGADAAARVRRLRRQHRLHAQAAGRRAAWCWRRSATTARVPRAPRRSWGVSTDCVARSPDNYTAQAIIITDADNNQITAFHPGAMQSAHETGCPRATTSSWRSSRPTAATR